MTSSILLRHMDGFLTQWDFHRVQEHPNRSSNEGDMTFRSWRSYAVNHDELSSTGPDDTHLTVQSKKTRTWSTGVQIKKFKSLTSNSLMWLQFTRRTHYQIPFTSYLKSSSKVWLAAHYHNVTASHGLKCNQTFP